MVSFYTLGKACAPNQPDWIHLYKCYARLGGEALHLFGWNWAVWLYILVTLWSHIFYFLNMIIFNVTGMNRFGHMFCTVKTSRNTIWQKKHLYWTNFFPIEHIPKFQLLDPSIFWDIRAGSCLHHLGNIRLKFQK